MGGFSLGGLSNKGNWLSPHWLSLGNIEMKAAVSFTSDQPLVQDFVSELMASYSLDN